MRKDIIVGIDVGTHLVKVIVARIENDGKAPHIIGTGSAPSRGLRHGYIIDKEDATTSISQALQKAQEESHITIDRAYVSIAGMGLATTYSQGSAIVARVNTEVTDVDTENALTEAEARISRGLLNKKILHAIPLSYELDGHVVLGSPLGMHGSQITVEALFITILEQHIADLVSSIEAAGVETIDVMASPIAMSLVTLNKKQKMVGCALTNIGAETVSLVVFEENVPISLKMFPVGSADITNALALQLRLPLEEAELIKKGTVTGSIVPQKKVNDIITSNLRTLFTLLQDHLKKINRAGLLPAGVVITGGGSGVPLLLEQARISLKLPAEITGLHLGEHQLKDASWAVAYGLCIWGASNNNHTRVTVPRDIRHFFSIFRSALRWVKQFLP